MTEYITPRELADRMDLSEFTVRRLIRSGKLKAESKGGSYLIARDDVLDFLAKREIPRLPGDPRRRRSE